MLKRIKLKSDLPHLYFASLLILWSMNGYVTMGPVLVALPFVAQVYFRNKVGNFLLGLVTLFCSMLLLAALLSDIFKHQGPINNIWFPVVGGTIVLTNFVMSVWLFVEARNAEMRERAEIAQREVSAAISH